MSKLFIEMVAIVAVAGLVLVGCDGNPSQYSRNEDGLEPTVYVVGHINIYNSVTDKYVSQGNACYWKNGNKTALDGSGAVAVAVSGKTVYIAGNDCVWKSDNGGSTWTKSKLPENTSNGYVTDMVVSGSFVYVSGRDSENAWCWKSVNAGATWTKITLPGGEGDVSADSILISNSAVYITGNTKTTSTNRVACYWKSVDGGDTWSKKEMSDGTGNASAGKIAISGGNIYITGSDYGTEKVARIWKSTDGGDTWSESTIHDGAEDRTYHIEDIVLMESGVIYISGHSNKGYLQQNSARACFWRSDDGGDTWSRHDFKSTNNSAHALSIAAVNTTVHVIGYWTTLGNYFPCYWRSDDGGKTWTETTLTDGDNRPWYNDIVLVWE